MQCLILAFIGFILSSILLEGFRMGIANGGVLFTYSPIMRVGFFVTTLVISVFGAVFAIRRITKLEPATVFRG
jgi:putative ABC transport system permease protein